MKFLFSIIILLFISTTVQSQQKRNVIWFTAKSSTTTEGFKEGQTIPNLSIKDVHKRRFNLHDELDKLTIIDLRKMDCKTCTQNNKYLQSFYKKYALNIISIYNDSRSVEVKTFAKSNGMNWTNVQDDAPPKELLKKQLDYADDEPSYIIISSEKKVLKVFYTGKSAGKLGVFLQQYFKDK
jgi:peroxiredoxin